MNEPTLPIRPQAVADYLRHRYQVQPGKSLCMVLGQPDVGDNYQALSAWAHGAVFRHSELPPMEQVRAIEHELATLMFESGVVDEWPEAREMPASLVARLFDPYNVRERQSQRERLLARVLGRKASNVIPFRKEGSHD